MSGKICRSWFRWPVLFALAGAISTTIAATPSDAQQDSLPETPAWVLAARASAGQLAARLIPTLQAAMQNGGPIEGIRVCSTEAPQIAAAVSDSDLRIGRTALRVRNPANAADAWEESVLEDFRNRIAGGADPATLEAWQVVTRGDQRVGRWMKAIPTAPMCTACHGTDIDAELAATIREHYPEDRATGFEAGDLRGAFTATVQISGR